MFTPIEHYTRAGRRPFARLPKHGRTGTDPGGGMASQLTERVVAVFCKVPLFFAREGHV